MYVHVEQQWKELGVRYFKWSAYKEQLTKHHSPFCAFCTSVLTIQTWK